MHLIRGCLVQFTFDVREEEEVRCRSCQKRGKVLSVISIEITPVMKF